MPRGIDMVKTKDKEPAVQEGVRGQNDELKSVDRSEPTVK